VTKEKQNKRSKTSVTRIVASESSAPKKAQETRVAVETAERTSRNPFSLIGGYFKGAWFELRQVRWPNRRATWSLTIAVLVFSAFFVVLILLLDVLFKYLFELILN